MSARPIRVLVAEDSISARLFLVQLLESDPVFRVVGAVSDGQEAIDFLASNDVDAVLMDLYMPRLDGFEATRRIMETRPVPIVICSSVADPKTVDVTFRALEAGALAFVEKPAGSARFESSDAAARLLETVRLMSEVKVVRRFRRASHKHAPPPMELPGATSIRIIGIGASTGGPPVLQTILAQLPKDFPVPIVVVQHIARGFLPGLAEWLNQTTPLATQIASYGVALMPGHVYLAPDDFHIRVSAGEKLLLTRQEPENGLRPSVSHLFRSLAEVYGTAAAGVLLTGMGRDGAEELKMMRDKGAVTIAQDRETSVIHGMPGAAIALGGASQVLPADAIADSLLSLVRARNHKARR